jgi:hypothetical protein
MSQASVFCRALLIMVIAYGICFADGPDDQTVQVNHHGFVAFENGQIVKGVSGTSGNEITRGWLERLILQFTNEFNPSPNTKLIMSVEGQFGFSYPQSISDRSTYLSRFWLYPNRVEGTYTFGNADRPFLQFELGYFPYKFNNYARNLGEFMFRSGTYPPYIVSNFNFPLARLLGARIGSTLWGSFRQDLLFTSEMPIFPTQDFSLSYLAHYTIAGCLELGAGIEFAHLFAIDDGLTSPTTFNSIEDKVACMYIMKNNDTGYYTFKGTKPAAMVGFDPKPLLPSSISRVMGKDDGLLYAEGCVIGWKNYTNYNTDTNMAYPDYHNRLDRTVAMVGMNIPAFRLLDILSLEFEFDPDRYPNNYKNVIDRNIPAYLVLPGKDLNPLKWSLYAKKTFFDRMSILGQIARDHMRPPFPSYVQTERDDVLPRSGDWWWVLRLTVNY